MREIEVKAKVVDKQALLDAIKRTGVTLSASIKHHDVVYGKKGMSNREEGSLWLRVRTENNTKTIFTLKQKLSGSLDAIEHETEVADGDEITAIISLLDFSLYSDLTKTRQKAKYNGIEICVDDVEGLGVYIEAERLADESVDGDAVVEELWSELAKLGIDRSDEVFYGYDVLLKQKNGK